MLPYGVKVQSEKYPPITVHSIKVLPVLGGGYEYWINPIEGIYNEIYGIKIENCKPYLRPMSSMTEEEENECIGISRTIIIPRVRNWYGFSITNPIFTDWLNAHQFDYRIDPLTGKTLIESGIALKAPDGMYKIK